MSTAIQFQHEKGWRKEAKVIEKPRGNDIWEVLDFNTDYTQVILRLGDVYRVYDITEWVNNDKCYGVLNREDSDMWP